MKYKWKKLIALSLVVCMFAISMTACGSSPAAEDETNAPVKLDAPESITDDAEKTEPNDDADVLTQTDTAEEAKNNVADALTQTDTAEEAENNNTDDTDTENTSEASGKWQVYDPDLAAAIDADFEGSVHEINADSFSILPIENSLLEDGSLLMVGTAPGVEISDEELVQVIFDDSTVFTIRDIYDGGARHEDSDASFEDIEKGVTVALKGEFQNDIFHSSAIRIVKVH